MGPVHPIKGVVIPGAQRDFDHIGQSRCLAHLRQMKHRPIGQDNRRNRALLPDERQNVPKPGVQRGLPATRKRDVVGPAAEAEPNDEADDAEEQ